MTFNEIILGTSPFIFAPQFGHRTRLYELDFENQPENIAKILDKSILITDTAAREAVEGYENNKIFANTEDGLYEGLKKITNKPINSLEKHYNNEARIEEIIKLIGG